MSRRFKNPYIIFVFMIFLLEGCTAPSFIRNDSNAFEREYNLGQLTYISRPEPLFGCGYRVLQIDLVHSYFIFYW